MSVLVSNFTCLRDLESLAAHPCDAILPLTPVIWSANGRGTSNRSYLGWRKAVTILPTPTYTYVATFLWLSVHHCHPALPRRGTPRRSYGRTETRNRSCGRCSSQSRSSAKKGAIVAPAYSILSETGGGPCIHPTFTRVRCASQPHDVRRARASLEETTNRTANT